MLAAVHCNLMSYARPTCAARHLRVWLLLTAASLSLAVATAVAQDGALRDVDRPATAEPERTGGLRGFKPGNGLRGALGARKEDKVGPLKNATAAKPEPKPSTAARPAQVRSQGKTLKIADIAPPPPVADRPETLADAIAAALASNIEILIAEAQRDEAIYGRAEARAGMLPNVELSAARGRETTRPDGSREPDDNTRSELSVALRQVLWDFGGVTNTARSADFNADSADWAYRAQVDQVALQIAGTFHDLLERQAIVAMAEKNVTAHETILRTVESQREFGMVTGADVSRVEGRLNAARSDLLDRRSSLEQARENYRRLLNRAPGKLAEPVWVDTLLPSSVDEAVLELERRNPNVMRAKSLLSSLQRTRAAQQAAMLPKFDLEVQGSIRTNVGGENGRNDDARAMVGVKVPLFDGGQRRAAVNRTSARLRQAELQIQRALRDAEQAIRNDYQALVSANEKVSSIDAEVAAGEKLVSLYAEQFRAGNRSVFDLLDGQQTLFTAQVRRESNRREKRLSGYRVLGTLGSLTSTLDVDRFGAPPLSPTTLDPQLAPLPVQNPAKTIATARRAEQPPALVPPAPPKPDAPAVITAGAANAEPKAKAAMPGRASTPAEADDTPIATAPHRAVGAGRK
jgi:outer membrane protein, adhesin transport system